MMRRSWRPAVYAVATGLLTAGTLTATMSAAYANLAGFCNGVGTKAACSETQTITAPTSVTIAATATTGSPSITWSATCTRNGATATTSGGTTGASPLTAVVALPFAAPATCTVSTTVTDTTTDAANALSVAMTYTTAASASPSASPSPTSSSPSTSGYEIKGLAGKCLDAAGNSSANRTKVQIWSCSGDRAQKWTYSNGELIHNGACLNDQRSGGSGSKVVLYTCNHALNELWTDLANGELVLNAQGYRLCLDDPASSTRNGTQLIVYTCHNGSNQHWKVP